MPPLGREGGRTNVRRRGFSMNVALQHPKGGTGKRFALKIAQPTVWLTKK